MDIQDHVSVESITAPRCERTASATTAGVTGKVVFLGRGFHVKFSMVSKSVFPRDSLHALPQKIAAVRLGSSRPVRMYEYHAFACHRHSIVDV
jgi:hypothetical protein